MSRLLFPTKRVTAVPKVLTAHPSAADGLKEAFVDYYSDSNGTIATLEFANEKPRVYPIDVKPSQAAEAVAALRKAFDRGKYRPGIDPNRPWSVNLSFVHELGCKLMPFLEDLNQADLVCFFPHGPLHNFPFHAVCGGDGEPLIRRVAVAYCPSRRVLSVIRGDAAAQGKSSSYPKRALVVGVPAATEREPELFYGDGKFLEDLGLKVTTLEGASRGLVRNVIRHMKTNDLLHLNCHGLFSAESAVESALLLSDGKEGPRDVNALDGAEAKKRLSARRLSRERNSIGTVVMRACSSGQTNVRLGDEQEGLLRALIQMGAATCIVTRWKIHIRSSRELLRSMYRYWLVGGHSKALALQKAQQWMLDQSDCEAWRHPYHWAPFILVGDWR